MTAVANSKLTHSTMCPFCLHSFQTNSQVHSSGYKVHSATASRFRGVAFDDRIYTVMQRYELSEPIPNEGLVA